MSELFSVASLGMAVDGAISRLVHGLTSPPLARGEEVNRALAKYRAAREETLAIIQDLTQVQADFFPGVFSPHQGMVDRTERRASAPYGDALPNTDAEAHRSRFERIQAGRKAKHRTHFR